MFKISNKESVTSSDYLYTEDLQQCVYLHKYVDVCYYPSNNIRNVHPVVDRPYTGQHGIEFCCPEQQGRLLLFLIRIYHRPLSDQSKWLEIFKIFVSKQHTNGYTENKRIDQIGNTVQHFYLTGNLRVFVEIIVENDICVFIYFMSFSTLN